MIVTMFPQPREQAKALGVYGFVASAGGSIGLLAGGVLTDAISWHWIFLINLPIGVLAFVYAVVVLPKDSVEPSESFDFVGMLLLSPGLAMFLYGVSSIPEAGTVNDPKVLTWVGIGTVLIIAFVPWALRPHNIHPLVDLRLLKRLSFTVAVLAMMLFAIAFFGASLLFPLYFQEVRGETALKAGLLLAPQGIGAMLTMPAAGFLSDKIGPGKIVMTGIVVITIGMAMFTRISEDTQYPYIIGALFIMGLGMGATMMPIMSAALATLSEHTIARGSTFLNITQQVAASIGTDLFSVLLTNGFKSSDAIKLAGAVGELKGEPAKLAALLDKAGLTPADLPDLTARALADMADAFSNVFVVATILVACCLIPAFFLPRKKAEKPVDPAAMMGH
jgi:EmrB/QacA subfamily drug resistance transporter